MAPEPELRSRLGQQPAELHPGFLHQFSAFLAAAIRQQIQLGRAAPATEDQGSNPRRSIAAEGGQLQPAGLGGATLPLTGAAQQRPPRGQDFRHPAGSQR